MYISVLQKLWLHYSKRNLKNFVVSDTKVSTRAFSKQMSFCCSLLGARLLLLSLGQGPDAAAEPSPWGALAWACAPAAGFSASAGLGSALLVSSQLHLVQGEAEQLCPPKAVARLPLKLVNLVQKGWVLSMARTYTSLPFSCMSSLIMEYWPFKNYFLNVLIPVSWLFL